MRSEINNTPFDTRHGVLARSALDIDRLASGNYWAELRSFLALAKTKSISRAAKSLNVSEKTVNRHIKRLQDQIGTPLIQSAPQGVSLTDSGSELACLLAQIDQDISNVANQIQAARTKTPIAVKIGITDALGAFFLAPALKDFIGHRTDIAVQFVSMLNAANIRENNVDILVTPIPVSGDDILVQPVGTVHFVPFVAHSYIKTFGEPNRENISQHTIVDNELYDSNFWAPWQEATSNARVRFKSETTFSFGTMVKSGVGIGLMGSWMAVDPALKYIDLNVHVSARLFAVSSHRSLDESAARAVFKWVACQFSAANPWFNEELILDPHPSKYDDGLRKMLNV